ncbi:MAG: hypothetical protein JU82_00385 [Sulfuricurvum sp. MLSB]|uniref:hypothetical protein n=1 Tax=unclassified Sulfuricurvum TaxID=2632390 RepID=UPI0004FFE1A6|nr:MULTISPECIES: hypothetical protein [unclassified Sulfuricurvum]KFN40872.1 MAG: hypothetical protein JU82_00385 [Sulfuricurvum sp. MLSB]
METFELYLPMGLFGLMYLVGLYLLSALKKWYPVVIYTLAYFSSSYAGYLINGKKGVVIAVETVVILALLYLRHLMNKRVDKALKRIEEKEHFNKV